MAVETLLRCLNGLIPHTYRGELSGQITIAGCDIRELDLAAIAATVGTVLQNPERQIVASHVFEEVAFGPENQGLPLDEIHERTWTTLRNLRLDHLAHRETFRLSGGEKQKLALAGILALNPQVILLDEPLANLDPQSASESLAMCRELAQAGHAVVIVEHRVKEVLAIEPERIALMEDGRIIALGTIDEVLPQADPRSVKLPAEIALRYFRGVPIEYPASRRTPPPTTPPLIELRDVHFHYDERPILQGVDFQVRAGERIAILGPNGSGKSTLIKHLIGLLRPRRGTVHLGDRAARDFSVAQIAREVGYVFQNPSQMIFAPTVREELAFGPQNLGYDAAEIAQHSAEALALVGLNDLEERPPLTLSFGQQRRLCIASVVAMRSGVLVMDEPTAGQDYRSYTQFMDGISQLDFFVAQVFITHDLDLALSYATRVVLFADGQIIADGDPADILTDEELLRRCRLRPTSLWAANLSRLAQSGRFLRLEHLAHYEA